MQFWVDADSCPVPIRELIQRAAVRNGIKVFFVANRKIPLPDNSLFQMIVTSSKENSADDYIVENAEKNDLVITRDIPLASRLVEKKVDVINDRGTLYTESNIRERLSVRDFMLSLAMNGLKPESTSKLGKKEIHNFANCFDRIVQKKLRENQSSVSGKAF